MVGVTRTSLIPWRKHGRLRKRLNGKSVRKNEPSLQKRRSSLESLETTQKCWHLWRNILANGDLENASGSSFRNRVLISTKRNIFTGVFGFFNIKLVRVEK